MANNSELKGTVNDYVKQNGAGGITGQGLQTILDTIIDSLGGKYQYAGVAAPSTNPGTPDQNVFYLAATAGTYTNFGGIVLSDGEVAVLKGSGSSWTKEVTGIATAAEVSQLGQYLTITGNFRSFRYQSLFTFGSDENNEIRTATDTYDGILMYIPAGIQQIAFNQFNGFIWSFAYSTYPTIGLTGGVRCTATAEDDKRIINVGTNANGLWIIITLQKTNADISSIILYGNYSAIQEEVDLIMAQSNKNKLTIDGTIDFNITSIVTDIYIQIPLALDAGSYVVLMEATGGSASVSLHDENKNGIKSYSAAFPYRFSINSANSCLYIRIEAGATATSIKLSFKPVASEYKPIPYLVEGLYTVNNSDTSNPKWSNNLSTKHYTIPVTAGDTLRGKGNTNTGAVVAIFVASQITTPTGGAAIPQISQFNFPKSVEASTIVPDGATYVILDGMPAYLYVNGVNVVNDVIQGLIDRVSGGDGFAFQGVATPSTSISTPESKAFYLGADGTYTNFGGSLTVPVGSIGIFTYNSGSWSLSTIAIKQPLDIPAGWKPYVDNAIPYVQANNLLSGQNGDSFVFVTDSHYPDNWGNSVKVAAAVSKKTNNRVFIHGGDFITTNQTRATFFGVLRDYASQLKALYGTAWRILFGNHDNNTQDSGGSQSELVTDNEFYAVAMKGFENEVVNPNRNLYYYWDNINQNIRYVCFNFGIGGAIDAQLSWFDSIVRNAPANAHICIVIHGMWGSGSSDEFMTQEGHLADMCDAINIRGTYTLGGTTYDYTNITPKVSAILCGHIHSFKQTYYGTSQIPVVALESDNYSGSEITYSQKVHFIDLDFTNGKMYIFTIGYNINDSQGRDNKTPIDIVV